MTGEMDGEDLEELVDRCIQRLIRGESLEGVLRSYPDQPQLRAALEPALAFIHSMMPDPAPRARSAAMDAMLRQVRAEAARPARPGVFRWLGTLRARPPAYQALAVVTAVAVVGGLGLGASAATGNAPGLVRSFFGISNAQASVSLTGPIISLDSGTLVLRTVSGERSIALPTPAVADPSQNQIDLSALAVGENVDVTATQRDDGTITAREIRPASEDATATPSAGAAAASDATEGHAAEPTYGSGDRHNGQTPTTQGADDGHGDRSGTPTGDSTPREGDGGGATRTPDHADSSASTRDTLTPTETPVPSQTPNNNDNNNGGGDH